MVHLPFIAAIRIELEFELVFVAVSIFSWREVARSCTACYL